jgi:hypothetical protein
LCITLSLAHFLGISSIRARNKAELATGGPVPCSGTGRRVEMLYTLAVILLIAWLLGVVGTYTIGAFVHLLLVVAVVLFLVGIISGNRTVV